VRRLRPDNVALVPASQLPFRKEWQAIANGLPPGSVLFVVPSSDNSMQCSMRRIAMVLQARGHHIQVMSELP